MMKMNFTNDQTDLEYAIYMIIGRYFKKVICEKAKLQERKLFLRYQEQKRNIQYYLEEQCIEYAEKELMKIFPEEILNVKRKGNKK